MLLYIMIKKNLNKIFKSPNIKSKKGISKKKKITNTMKFLQAIDNRINNIRKNPIIIDDKTSNVKTRTKSHPMEEKDKDLIIDEFSDDELIRNEKSAHEYLWNNIKPIFDDFKSNKMDDRAKDKVIKNLITIRNKAHELYDPNVLDSNLISIIDEYKNMVKWIGRQKGAYESVIMEFRNKHMK